MATKEPTLFDDNQEQKPEPVECLGMTFASDEERRTYFLDKLREKLKDPEFRKIEGFPIGSDEDILALSDPPYYTACPNPFIEEFLRHIKVTERNPDEEYQRKPFTTDVSEGKNDSIYNAHGYHTKVPPKAVVRYILHYTKPGDVIYDGFCGSGMTGVGASLCGASSEEFRRSVAEGKTTDAEESPAWGLRHALLSDLSPIASFITYNYNCPLDNSQLCQAWEKLSKRFQAELEWMYQTSHPGGGHGRINFTVWSEVFHCPQCSNEIVYVKEALDPESHKVRDNFPCPHCTAKVTKRSLEKYKETFVDPYTGLSFERNKRVPILINYSVGTTKYEKEPDNHDFDLLKQIERDKVTDWFPQFVLPYTHMTHERVKIADYGVHYYHHFFFPRQLRSLALMWRLVSEESDVRIRHFLQFLVEQCVWGMSVLNRYSPSHFSQVNRYLSGVYYVPSQTAEVSPWYILDGKYKRVASAARESWPTTHSSISFVADCSASGIPDCSVDYIFTDPPFGENIYYSDLNLLLEAWHQVSTNAENEAIIDKAKKKGLHDYQELMRGCFCDYFRVLKSNRWMTVVFHNSHNSIWNAIQEAISSAGFVIGDVRTLDKKQASYRQVTAATAVKQDLVISAYKTDAGFDRSFEAQAGTEEGCWEFVRQHLRQLPIFVISRNKAETIAERKKFLLFDRMVAFHIQRGFTVPLTSGDFYLGLHQRFPERDDMYFLPDQVHEYEKHRLTVEGIEQLELFVSDEKTAIQWVRQRLQVQPISYSALQPQYMKEAQRVWDKHEHPIELQAILDENFIQDEQGSWHVPDPKKESDLEQLRQRHLLKEFEQYREIKGKLKIVRSEALRAGFKECWQAGDYENIIQLAKRLPDAVVQEDPALLMYYDNAQMRIEG